MKMNGKGYHPNGKPHLWLSKAALYRIENRLEREKAARATLVYLGMCRIADEDHSFTFEATISKIASRSYVGYKTAARALPDLTHTNVITVTPRRIPGTRANDASIYHVLTPEELARGPDFKSEGLGQPTGGEVSETTTDPRPETPKEFNSLEARKRRPGEKEAIQRMVRVMGGTTAANWGGLWRNRYRQNPSKFNRVMDELESVLREQTIDNPGGYADDLWKRFVN